MLLHTICRLDEREACRIKTAQKAIAILIGQNFAYLWTLDLLSLGLCESDYAMPGLALGPIYLVICYIK